MPYPNPQKNAIKFGVQILDKYDKFEKDFAFLCSCGSKGVISFSTLATGFFCRNDTCSHYQKVRKVHPREMKIIAEERGCTEITIKRVDGKTPVWSTIKFICSCGFKQEMAWKYFYREKWCQHFDCPNYHKFEHMTTDIMKNWFSFEDYTYSPDIVYDPKIRGEKYELACPENHKAEYTVDMWMHKSRCKLCHGNNKTLSYEQIKHFYNTHGCTLVYDKSDYKGNVTTNLVEYICSEGHRIVNLTKNDFNTRINAGLGPCAECRATDRGGKKALIKAGKRCIGCRNFFTPDDQEDLCSKCQVQETCAHGKYVYMCKECNESNICAHGRMKYRCKECVTLCKHKRLGYQCRECNSYVPYCEHKRVLYTCADCNPATNIVHRQIGRIISVLEDLGIPQKMSILEYIGCSPDELWDHIKTSMKPGMTLENIHIDHIKPVSRFNLRNEEQFRQCFHFSNLQPLFKEDNIKKGNKWSDKDEKNWRENICDLWLV